MAKAKKDDAAPPPKRDGEAGDAHGFEDLAPVGEVSDAPPAADPRDAEIAALKARVAELEAAGPPAYAPGKYRVELPDCRPAVVEPAEGEHPWDAFRRLAGVVSSTHQPAITRAADDAACGHLNPDGTVQPFATA